MPVGRRVRANNVFGVVNNAPLSAGDTTLNSVELTLLPEISGSHAVLTLDPLRINGTPEIVVVTAHSAGAQTAVLTRGAYGTIARSHPQGTEWVHGPMDEDVISVVTSSTRPADPYEGQLIYETDTNALTARIAGTWTGLIPVGVIQAYGGTSPPPGWLMCNGQAVNRTTYAALFTVVGVSYGAGDGSTTFNLPDLRDRVPLGVGTNFATRGAVGGSKDAVVVSHNHSQNSHNHTQNAHGHGQDAHEHGANADDNMSGEHSHSPNGAGGGDWGVRFGSAGNGLHPGGERATFTSMANSGSHHHDIWVDVHHNTINIHNATATNNGFIAINNAEGVSGTNANMQPYQTVNYMIKV